MFKSRFLALRRVKGAWLSAGVLAVAVAATATLFGASDSSAADNTVRTEGTAQFIPNHKLAFTLHFSPGHQVVKNGETLTLEHSDKTDQPHTLSIVDAEDVPTDIDGVFTCGEPDTVCDEVFQLFGPEEDPALLPRSVEGPGTVPGLDGRLDSLLVFPGESVSADVTAPAGTTLNFICAIHAWMQGTIDVK